MSSGQVKCCGSTLFLKKLYHVGYLLRLELTPSNEADNILSLIKKHIPNATYENQQSNELFFRLLPNDDDNSDNLNLLIADLFDEFEEMSIREKYGIKAYGLTNTSLEDVFIKIGELDNKENQEETVDILNDEDHPLYNLNRVGGASLYLQQFFAVFDKKLRLTYKNLSLFVSSIYPLILPIILLVLYSIILKQMNQEENFTYNSFNPKDKFGDNEVILIKSELDRNDDNLFKKENRDWIEKTYGVYFSEKDTNNASQAIIDEAKKVGFEKFNEKFYFTPKRIAPKSYKFFLNGYKLPYSYINLVDIFYQQIAKLVNREFVINTKFNFIKAEEENSRTIYYKYFGLKVIFSFLATIAISIMFSFPYVAFVDLVYDEMNSGALSMQIIAGLSKTMYWVANFVFDYIFMFLILSISCLLILIFDSEKFLSPDLWILFTDFVLTAFACILVTYFIVNLNIKREITDILVKYYLLVLGAGFGVADLFYMNLTFDGKIRKKSMPTSFFFKVLSPIYNALDTIFYILDEYAVKKCKELPSKDLYTQELECGFLSQRDYSFWVNLLQYLLSYFMYAFLIFLVNYFATEVLMFFEKFAMFRKKQADDLAATDNKIVNINHLNQIKDENVEREKELANMIVETRNLQNNILVVNDLYKLFGTFEAVNHLNFTVKRGECFGLLGK